MNKYNERLISRLHNKGENIIRMVKFNKTLQGSGHVLADGVDNSNRMLAIIEQLKGLNTDHDRSPNKARYAKRFERERESALAELWGMYEALQHYSQNGVFLDGSQRGMQAFTPRLEEHLIRARSEAPPCGTYYRNSESSPQEVTEGPLARVKGLECEAYGPRWESRREFKLCSKVDGNTGGRSVMAIGSTGAYPKGTKFETYEVKMVSRNNRYMFPRGAGEWSYTVKRAVYKG
jgi:hypothetical protein